MFQTFKALIFLSLSCVFFSNCAKTSGNSSSAAPAAATTSTTASSSNLPGFGALTGQLVMEVNGVNLPAANANVTVASHPEYSVKADAKGSFTIANMVPGTLTIYADAPVGTAALTASADAIRAAQFKNVVVATGTSTSLPADTVLTKPGSISGTIFLINNPQNVELVGIDVYVPGTSFAAKTDANGAFTMSNVPTGKYDVIRFDKDGLTSTELADVEVDSGINTDLGVIYMSLSTGPSGRIVSIDQATTIAVSGQSTTVLQNHTVKANLLYDSRAVLMKVAHESAFLNVDWVPVATSFTFTTTNNSAAVTNYATDGAKSVYVKFADTNGLESSTYKMDFIIDAAVPTITSFLLVHGWDQVANHAASLAAGGTGGMHLDLVAGDGGTGVKEMMFCNTNDFPACGTWEPYTTSRAGWPTPASGSSVTVYAVVRDYVDRISAVAQDSINIGSKTILPGGTHSENVTLYQEETPHRFSTDATFTGNLTIEAGVALDTDNFNKITVNGRLTAAGTSQAPITIAGGFSGFNLMNSTADDNLISYINIGSGGSNGTFLIIDGGIVTHNTISVDTLGSFVEKHGYKKLTVSKNSVTSLLGTYVTGGAATTISDNVFNNTTNCNGTMPVGFWQTGGSGTVVEYNTFISTCASYSSNPYLIYIVGGDIIFRNNTIATTDNGSGTAPGIYVYSSSAIVTHNNILVSNSHAGNAALVSHLITDSGGTIAADYNDYEGSGTNPTTTGANITSSHGTTGSAWPTTAGAGCVGAACR